MLAPLSLIIFAMTSLPMEDAPAVSDVWQMDKETSQLSFTAVEEGKTFTGYFSSFDAEIHLDPDDLSGASIEAVVHLASVDAGSGDRNATLPEREWFRIKKFPDAGFSSHDIHRSETGGYVASGTMRIKGIEQPVDLPFTLEIVGHHGVAEGEFTLNRMDFKIGEGGYKSDSWISHEVTVQLHIEADRL